MDAEGPDVYALTIALVFIVQRFENTLT